MQFATIVLDQVLVREEQKVGVFQRLIYIPVGHQLLVCESLVSFCFLEPGVNMGGGELCCSRDCFWDDTFEILDDFFKV